jgi:RNA polymerase sigma factor (TIGR02999 family)
MNELTAILGRAAEGNPQAAEALLPLVYDDLRKLAAYRLARLGREQTLQPTALVHEAWLRLVDADQQNWQNRAHFFAAAAEAMRRVLIDAIRAKGRLKRGGGQEPLNLEELEIAGSGPDEKVLLVNEALEQLQAVHPEKARVVVLKFFGGLTDKEAALSLGVTERTIERHWAYAKAWLLHAIESGL